MQYPANLITTIADGGYAVMPTDTIYGIVCDALNKDAVEGLYGIKKRDLSKPLIVLLADLDQLQLFHISWEQYADTLRTYWPGPVSIILPCSDERLAYLHRGTKTIAFRLPADKALQELLWVTGPLVAPSANPEQLAPATTIAEAKEYFGNQVACYVDGGEVRGSPSSLLSIGENGIITTLR